MKETEGHRLLARAEELRRNSTSAEKILWNELRRCRIESLKFRRQQPLGPFIADFYCPRLRLAIELDGDSHADKEEYDASRQQYIESRGVVVMRFSNTDVRENLPGVLQAIYDFCSSRQEN
jgi:very-short-patch-repair endonuclease